MSVPEGMTPQQVRLLRIVQQRGSATGAELRGEMGGSKAIFHYHVSSLLCAGLVSKCRSTEMRRGAPPVLWSVTDAGHKVLSGTLSATAQKALARLLTVASQQRLPEVRALALELELELTK